MSRLRSALAAVTRRTPMFRGKGRIVLALDKLLTDYNSPASYEVVDTVNGRGKWVHDLRPWGGKFGYYYGEIEPDFIRITRELYRGGTFLDVGSCAGIYPVSVADLVRTSGSRIVSVEPVPSNIDVQRRNLALNEIDDIVDIQHVALGKAPGELRLEICDVYGWGNAFVHENGAVRVQVVTLDAMVERLGVSPIGFLKMDVEGFEPAVIEGGRQTIARDKPVIFAEFNRERMNLIGLDMRPAWAFLMERGYSAFEVAGGQLKPLPQPGEVENIFFLP